MNRVLAIDYGQKRIGIAMSDPLKIIAKPYDIIENTCKDLVFLTLDEIIVQKNVDVLVIGLPKNMNGSIGFQAKEVQAYFKDYNHENLKKIVYIDERNSSTLATDVLRENGLNEKKQRKIKDAYAASIILKDYLEYGD